MDEETGAAFNAYRNMVFSYILTTDESNKDFVKNILDIIASDLPSIHHQYDSFGCFIVMLCTHGCP